MRIDALSNHLPPLFAGAAEYYVRYRSEYPAPIFTELAGRLGLDGRQSALDLGCGPGMATFGLTEHVASVTAVDPDREMLAAGHALAVEKGVDGIDWREGSSEDLAGLGVGPFDLALMAASFHWMDRPATLAALDKLINPGGAVVIITGSMSGLARDTPNRPAWAEAAYTTRERWAPSRRRWRGDTSDNQSTYTLQRGENRAVLEASAFASVDSYELHWQRTHTVDELIGLLMTVPDLTPTALGDRIDGFRTELREALLAAQPGEHFVEPIWTQVLIGRRPTD
ncbi:class I SAM-dependent methyltransferase [Kribbella ginsengisoli]|uniref:class I SAM-dependent methyltransferase n=1 Tax=Kribbella ginsengisoli TaxID=363865 RepID=UPI0031DB1585